LTQFWNFKFYFAPLFLFVCLFVLNKVNIDDALFPIGVCVVPGSGFGQMDGTFHFRTTILPPEQDMEKVLAGVTSFYREFVAKYS
jgi:aspartate/methionine/tyrosine aminotransferase